MVKGQDRVESDAHQVPHEHGVYGRYDSILENFWKVRSISPRLARRVLGIGARCILNENGNAAAMEVSWTH